MAQREQHIYLALEDLRTGVFSSIRAAGAAYHVRESTLRTRLDRTTNQRTTHQYRKRLSIRQEEFLDKWIHE